MTEPALFRDLKKRWAHPSIVAVDAVFVPYEGGGYMVELYDAKRRTVGWMHPGGLSVEEYHNVAVSTSVKVARATDAAHRRRFQEGQSYENQGSIQG